MQMVSRRSRISDSRMLQTADGVSPAKSSASSLPRHRRWQSPPRSKRLFDLAGSLVLLAPAILVVVISSVLLVAVDRRSPFYLDRRIGWGGRPFRCLKLQTMSPDRRILEDYLRDHPEEAERYLRERKLSNDPRVSRLGSWLRRASIDEVPQIWNVFRGDMSLVGPRPLSAAEFELRGHRRTALARFRPGMTGLWQVSGRSQTSVRRRHALDHVYVTRWRPWLDLYVILMTPVAVLRAKGAT
jgi:lipopolysaccharide/colanic/teichoic acid biosynthesis glycosyltransferase